MSFLASYIQNESPEIEDVLLDSELSTEIKTDNKITLNFILKNFNKVLSYITEEPDIKSNSKRSLNLPFIVSELFCYNIKDLQSRLLMVKFSEEKEKEKTDENCNFFLDKFFKYIDNTDVKTLVESTLPSYCFKVLAKLIKTNFNVILKNFSDEENFANLIKCLQKCIFLDSCSDILLLFYANEIEQYSDFKSKLTNKFIDHLSFTFSQIDGLIKSKTLVNKSTNNIDLEISIMFDTCENILKFIMKQMKVITIIEKDDEIRQSYIKEVIFNKNYFNCIKDHLILIIENFADLKDHWEITRSMNSSICFVNTLLVYLSNKNEFESNKLENILSMFLFDEILDLDLIPEYDEESKEEFKNNLKLNRSDTNQIIEFLLETFFNICLEIVNKISNTYNKPISEVNPQDKVITNFKNLEVYKVREIYLYILDFVILILSNHEIDQSIIKTNFLENIFQNFNKFNGNTFYLNKTIKLLEIIISNHTNNKIKNLSPENSLLSQIIKSDCLKKLISQINFENFYTTNTKFKINEENNEEDKENQDNQQKYKKCFNNNSLLLNSAQSYIIYKTISNIDNLAKYEEEYTQIFKDKEELYKYYSEISNLQINQKRQSPSDLVITNPNIELLNANDKIDYYDCKYFSEFFLIIIL